MKGRADNPSVPRTLGDHDDRIRKLEFAATAHPDYGIAHALFSVAEMVAGATKTLVAASSDTVIIPLDFYVVASSDFSPLGGQPDVNLETPSWNWAGYNINSFGTTFYTTATIMASAPGTDSVPRSLAGETLQARIDPLGMAGGVGEVEVFVRWYRARITT